MTSTQVYAREVIEEVGWWNEYLTMGEDTALNVSILKLYPNDCIQVEASTGTYRVHPLQTTKGGDSHGAESGIMVEGRPDTFENMVAQLREDDPSMIGEATLNAVGDLLDGSIRLCLSGVREVQLNGQAAVIVTVCLIKQRDKRNLAGCSLDAGNVNQTVVFATLDAVNRVLGKLGATSSVEYRIT